MKIAELFYSMQGEGVAGRRAVGLHPHQRLQPALLVVRHAVHFVAARRATISTLDQILDEVRAHPARHVVVTGGEPMIAPEIVPLTERLRELGLHITIETAGTVFQPVACDLMSISPKLANSTPEGRWAAQHERLRIQPAVLAELMARYDYQLKFVIEKPADLEEVRALVATLAGRSRARHPDAGGHRPATVCASAACGWRRSARRKASGSARGCTWICTATGEESEMETRRHLLADPIFREHLQGREHPERPERFDAVVGGAASERACWTGMRAHSTRRAATEDELALCHTHGVSAGRAARRRLPGTPLPQHRRHGHHAELVGRGAAGPRAAC